MFKSHDWLRIRFIADYSAPSIWPPVGPFWCSGYTAAEDKPVMIAYVKHPKEILDYWPEATNIEEAEKGSIRFTDRFQKPDWWDEEKEEYIGDKSKWSQKSSL